MKLSVKVARILQIFNLIHLILKMFIFEISLFIFLELKIQISLSILKLQNQ